MTSSSSTECQHSGCFCKAWVEATSKWSKGKCKNCTHSLKQHARLEVNISFDSTTTIPAPMNSTSSQLNQTYSSNIDNSGGILPSGKSNNNNNNKNNNSNSNSNPNSTFEQCQLSVEESDWFNWGTEQVFAWLIQPQYSANNTNTNTNDNHNHSHILHELQTNNVNGQFLSQLSISHSLMLSFGFKNFKQRKKLMKKIQILLNKYPISAQQQLQLELQTQEQEQKRKQTLSNPNPNTESQSQTSKVATNQKLFHLDENEWKQWTAAEVFEWFRFELEWDDDTLCLDYIAQERINRINDYQVKCLSADVNLNGQRLTLALQNQYSLLKTIGFKFSERKQIVTIIQNLTKT